MKKTGWLALGCLSLMLFLGKAYETSLPPNDSALHATVALGVTSQGPAPRIPIEGVAGYDGRAFNDHPFTFFYLNGWMLRAFGPSTWSARLLPALLSAGTVLLTAALGTTLGAPGFGLVAALLLALTPEYIKMGANFHLDLPMIFFILLSFVAWFRGRPLWAGLAAGLGVWVKTPVALLIVPVALLHLLLTRRDPAERRAALRSWLVMTGAALALSVLLWVVVAAFGGVEVVRDYWSRQVWGTAVGGRGHAKSPDLLLFFRYVGRRFLPWTLLLVASLFLIARRKQWRQDRVLVPLLGAGVLAAALSPLRFKYDYYFLPAFPFLALLSAYPLAGWAERRLEALRTGLIGFTLVLLTFAVVTPLRFAPEAFPALRLFNALIQSYGDCSDRVLFIPGQQPYASAGDYSIEVAFYTGRKLIEAPCDRANELARDPAVQWILLTEENLAACLSEETRAGFTGRFAFGNQLLLSRRIAAGAGPIDLTPLQRQGRAVTDCRPAPYLRDRYHRYSGESEPR